MTFDNKLLATTSKVITTYLMVFGIMGILHWLDPERNTLTLLGFWTVMVWCWKLLNYGDNLTAAAVFGPTPGTPLMLSTASPVNAK